MGLLGECSAATESPAVQAVLTFLRSAPLDQLRLPADYDVGGAIACVDGRLVTRPAFRPALLGGLWRWATNQPGRRAMRCSA